MKISLCLILFIFSDAETPELLPVGYLVGDTMQIGICLKGEYKLKTIILPFISEKVDFHLNVWKAKMGKLSVAIFSSHICFTLFYLTWILLLLLPMQAPIRIVWIPWPLRPSSQRALCRGMCHCYWSTDGSSCVDLAAQERHTWLRSSRSISSSGKI